MRYTSRMFGMRVLIFLLGVALVVWILVRLARGSSLQHKATPKVDEMVRCEKCGVFTPRSEAVRDGEKFYCSPQHRDEDR